MVAQNYAGAVRAGAMAAARIHRDMTLKETIEARGGNVDVFKAIHQLDVTLLLRPLKGLLGAFLNEPSPGILVTTERPMSIQRFTAAHELGHYIMKHEPSLDDESMLRRMPINAQPASDLQEVEADAFATAFMLPAWLLGWHMMRQGWTVENFRRPSTVYQFALRLGASYEATCWTLVRNNLIDRKLARELLLTKPRELKAGLLEPYEPENYRGDVWLLTEKDADTRIDGSRNDHFVLRLKEHSGGGYLWDMDQLNASGFAIVREELEAVDGDGVGGPVVRRVTAQPTSSYRGTMAIDERRPWDLDDAPLTSLEVEFDLTGPEEEGLSRAERRDLLEAA
jgi:Zn-dependent peptidase ImmA (M78 family)